MENGIITSAKAEAWTAIETAMERVQVVYNVAANLGDAAAIDEARAAYTALLKIRNDL